MDGMQAGAPVSQDSDYSPIKMDNDGKVKPSDWKWDTSSIAAMKKILLAMTPGSFADKEKDSIRIMDGDSVILSFSRKFPEFISSYYPSDLRSIERALQLNWETFESQFMNILGKIKSKEAMAEIDKKQTQTPPTVPQQPAPEPQLTDVQPEQQIAVEPQPVEQIPETAPVPVEPQVEEVPPLTDEEEKLLPSVTPSLVI